MKGDRFIVVVLAVMVVAVFVAVSRPDTVYVAAVPKPCQDAFVSANAGIENAALAFDASQGAYRFNDGEAARTFDTQVGEFIVNVGVYEQRREDCLSAIEEVEGQQVSDLGGGEY